MVHRKGIRGEPLVLKVNNDLVRIEIVVQPLTDRGPVSFISSLDTSPDRRVLLKRRHQLHMLNEV